MEKPEKNQEEVQGVAVPEREESIASQEVSEPSHVDNTKLPDKPEESDAASSAAADNLESAYTSLETKFTSLWTSALESAQSLPDKINIEERKSIFMSQLNSARENINNNESVQNNIQSLEGQLKDLGDHVKNIEAKIDFKSITSQANKALDTLDSKLEGIELQAGKFVSLFTSFFSSMVKIDTPVSNETKEPETLFSSPAVPSAAYGSTRYETDLFKLHTNEAQFFDDFSDDSEDVKQFEIDSKTDEIANLLKKYPDTLEKLMNKIVPLKIPYDVFWYRYFKKESELKESEQKRKQLLNQDASITIKDESKGDDEEDEEDDFTWDDEDDEEINAP